MMAESWLVYQLSNSALALGVIRFLNTIPVTLLTLVGGVVADRFEKRRILVSTQTLSMLLAGILAGLVYFNVVRLWHVALLGLFLGIANAFDIPARQSFVVEMVGRKDLMNAIALSSSMFNAGRIVGPALAGLLIGTIGLAGCFLLNSLSFLAVIAGYLAMRLPRTPPPSNPIALKQATLEALRYVAKERVLRAVLVLVSTVSLFGWPYSVLMPIFARDVLHVGATGYGFLLAANGVGALLGAFTLATLGDYPKRRHLVFGGLFGFSAAIFGFAFSKQVWLSATALAAAGWFMIVFFATANTSIQLRAPDALRGRIMGIYSLCFIGLTPLGSLMAGGIAKLTSATFAVAFGSVICVIAALVTMKLVPAQKAQPQEAISGA